MEQNIKFPLKEVIKMEIKKLKALTLIRKQMEMELKQVKLMFQIQIQKKINIPQEVELIKMEENT